MRQKIFRTGNSLAVVVPANFIRDLGLKPGDKVNVFARPEKGEILYKFSGVLQLPLDRIIFKKKRKKALRRKKSSP